MESISGLHQHISLALGQLLRGDEVVAIVDDDDAIRAPLKAYFAHHGLPVVESATGNELMTILRERNVALVLLDIGLPDTDGLTLLPQIVDQYPDLAVVMLTGMSDLQVALDCMRKGATDFLSKPVQFDEIFHVVRKALEKRRLILENRKYQEELEEAHFRLRLLHHLSLKMNSVYLSTVELDELLRAILVGITAQEGLGFNRAFLLMFDEEGRHLEGRMAVGPNCREEAGRIWGEMQSKELDFGAIVHNIREQCEREDLVINRIVRQLSASVGDQENMLLKAAESRRSILVSRDFGSEPILLSKQRSNGPGPAPPEGERLPVPHELCRLLDEDTFVVVPLYSPSKAFGVIIADNYVTRRPIQEAHISVLELFASQASLAIEQSNLYLAMQGKIAELQDLNEELNKNKDLLVEAERYSALGQMAAQLVHTIRNPITSIGGVSRILAKKTSDESWLKYLNVITKETARLESTLTDLFDFVTQSQLVKIEAPVCNLLKKTLLLLQSEMEKQQIAWEVDCPEMVVVVVVDERQMRQVFLHLLKNGVEAMPQGGKLTIKVRQEAQWIRIVVRDTGLGMPESQLARVRDPFFTTKTYGTGMGLTLVERVVAAHGGRFNLKTNPTGGMEATVLLPLPGAAGEPGKEAGATP